MRKEKIIEILADWNFWEKKPELGIARQSYLERLENLAKTGQVVTLEGVRRSGKTTLLLQYINRLIEKGVESRNTLYVNFEDPRFFGELSPKSLQEIYEAYLELKESKETPYLFLDEVQYVPAWEKFVRALHERKEANIFVSGSSSKLLSAEFGSALTGRHVSLKVYPLNFREFLYFNRLEVKGKLDLVSNRARIKRFLRDYLEFGGFPKVVLSAEKNEILVRYFNDVISRDVAVRYRVKNIEKLQALAKYLLTNTSSLVSFNRIKKFLHISLDTVERFSYYLSYAYLVYFVKKFSYSLKEQEVNPRKVYCIDTGLRNITGFRISEDAGKLYENLVFLELERRGRDVYYWKNKGECDFLVKRGRRVDEAIQVCFDVEKEETRKRELKGLVEAVHKFKLSRGLIVTEDYESEERVGQKRIEFVPLWKWLLQ